MKAKLSVCLSLVAFLAFALLVSRGEGQEAASPWDKLGKPAAPLTGLEWVKGKPVQMKKGSVYVVEFWATWCPPCLTSIPHLTELQHQFRDKGVTIIGISNETVSTVKPFIEAQAEKMDYTVAVDTGRQVSKGYMTAFNVRGIPHAFVVGKDGNLLWHGHPMAGLDEVLEKVVADEFDVAVYAAEEEERARLLKLANNYFAVLRTDGNEAAQMGAQIVDGVTDARLLNAFSWKILTDVPEGNRDLELAQQAALKAVRLTEEKDASILDTCALALYELGKTYVGQAVTYQKKAVSLAEGNDRMRQSLQKALERYESASVK